MFVAILTENLTGDRIDVIGPYDTEENALQSCAVIQRDQKGFDKVTFCVTEVRDPASIAPLANSTIRAADNENGEV